jgi:hypothetical protein
MDEPDENTERRENCRDYQDDPYVRAACREGRCQCLDEGTGLPKQRCHKSVGGWCEFSGDEDGSAECIHCDRPYAADAP